jgi:hypothetical protein
MKVLLFLGCLLGVIMSLPSALNAQQIPIMAAGEEGTPVVAVAQTRDGFIWASYYGLSISRYDGVNQKVYGADAGVIGDTRHLVEDERGPLWIGGKKFQGGAGRLRGSSTSVLGGLLPAGLHFSERMGGIELAGVI